MMPLEVHLWPRAHTIDREKALDRARMFSPVPCQLKWLLSVGRLVGGDRGREREYRGTNALADTENVDVVPRNIGVNRHGPRSKGRRSGARCKGHSGGSGADVGPRSRDYKSAREAVTEGVQHCE
jgi:hypothetical protein